MYIIFYCRYLDDCQKFDYLAIFQKEFPTYLFELSRRKNILRHESNTDKSHLALIAMAVKMEREKRECKHSNSHQHGQICNEKIKHTDNSKTYETFTNIKKKTTPEETRNNHKCYYETSNNDAFSSTPRNDGRDLHNTEADTSSSPTLGSGVPRGTPVPEFRGSTPVGWSLKHPIDAFMFLKRMTVTLDTAMSAVQTIANSIDGEGNV